jgi:hypothetical protein
LRHQRRPSNRVNRGHPTLVSYHILNSKPFFICMAGHKFLCFVDRIRRVGALSLPKCRLRSAIPAHAGFFGIDDLNIAFFRS